MFRKKGTSNPMKKSGYLVAAVAILCSCVHRAPAQTAAYPSAIVTDANLKIAVNGVSTLLTVAANISQTTMTISSCAGIVANVLITIDSEIMPVTGCSGTILAVGSRGFDSSTAAAHVAGSAIYAYVDAWHHNSLRVEMEAVETALGVSLANVLTPTTGVHTFNTRLGTVVLLAADVAAVEQDLRTSASPTFVGETLTAGGSQSTNSGGYAYYANQTTGGGFTYTGSGAIYSGTTTGHTLMTATSTDGTCTMRGDTGLSCSNTQALLITSAPQFDGLTLTSAIAGTSGAFTGDVNVSPTIPSLPFSTATLLCTGSGSKGKLITVTDSNTSTWGAVIAGSGANIVLGFCNGTALTVAGK